ncbi:DUF4235 domain-containing protein [Planomonospora corallina]|uniref:DUF4235 domain-containing protein n=1 Tax=Planomonospora corallina TaxID=1806052 RepID=A0ABV8I9R4_9ACTN
MSDTLVSRTVGLAGGMAGGLIAGAIFKQIWKFASGKEEAPQATSEEYGWREVLVAAAIQGAIYGMVKAAIDRSTVHGTPRSGRK